LPDPYSHDNRHSRTCSAVKLESFREKTAETYLWAEIGDESLSFWPDSSDPLLQQAIQMPAQAKTEHAECMPGRDVVVNKRLPPPLFLRLANEKRSLPRAVTSQIKVALAY